MFDAGVLTFQEFMVSEPLPLATIQNAALEFLGGRDDAVVIGAQAVNAYVNQARMTQDIDLVSNRAEKLAQELRDYLSQKFQIAVQIQSIGQQRGCRIYQLQKAGNRHLIDVRSVQRLPSAKRISDVLVIAPEELVASKVIAYHRRRGTPKSGTDWRDIAVLLLAFPDLKNESGPVFDCLQAAGADSRTLDVWKEFVVQEIQPEDEEDKF